MIKLVLASSSPRRRMLLENLGVDFDIIPPSDDEVLDSSTSPRELAQQLARNKALQCKERAGKSVVIGADTVVVKNGTVLGKPADSGEARAMLRLLSGGPHRVITGLCVIDEQGRDRVDAEETIVYFRDLTDREIENYIATGEPLDKAGAYGIQGYGALLVSRIEGCFYNVVGLPLVKLDSMLKLVGINIL